VVKLSLWSPDQTKPVEVTWWRFSFGPYLYGSLPTFWGWFFQWPMRTPCQCILFTFMGTGLTFAYGECYPWEEHDPT
jgi:hypothetical protein